MRSKWLFLGAVAAANILGVIATIALIQDWSWSARFAQAVQLDVTVLAVSVDLGLMWFLILGPHFHKIMKWMDKAFSDEGLETFTVCPRCAYTAKEEDGAKAFLRGKTNVH